MAALSGAAVRWSVCAACVAWLVALPASAYIATHPAIGFAPVKAFAFATYALGSVVCHQRPERSFHLGGVQLPVCARCVGVYVGAVLAALSVVTAHRASESRPEGRVVALVLAVSAVPALATLVYEWTTGVLPGGVARALSGVPIGASMLWAVLTSIRDREQVR